MQLSCGKQLGNGEAEIGDLSTPQQARTAIQIQSQGTKGNILEKSLRKSINTFKNHDNNQLKGHS